MRIILFIKLLVLGLIVHGELVPFAPPTNYVPIAISDSLTLRINESEFGDYFSFENNLNKLTRELNYKSQLFQIVVCKNKNKRTEKNEKSKICI
jgi:hypothetical protein